MTIAEVKELYKGEYTRQKYMNLLTEGNIIQTDFTQIIVMIQEIVHRMETMQKIWQLDCISL